MSDAAIKAHVRAILQRLKMSATKWDWTCGHHAGAMCAECWRELAAKAIELAEENLRLRAELDRLGRLKML
jgi:hypothetical protein